MNCVIVLNKLSLLSIIQNTCFRLKQKQLDKTTEWSRASDDGGAILPGPGWGGLCYCGAAAGNIGIVGNTGNTITNHHTIIGLISKMNFNQLEVIIYITFGA